MREKVIKGLESLHKRLLDAAIQDRIAMLDANIVSDAIVLLKDNGQDEGWLCEKRTSGRQPTDLLCACGNKVYFTTLLFKDGFTANELYCSRCGLSMRSPQQDKDGMWLRKHWEEVVLKAQEPRVMTLEEVKASKGDDMFLEISTRTDDIPYITAATLDGAGTKGVVFYCSHLDYVAYNRRLYGWRCWTSRPTDEQRKAAKWDDA